MIGIISDTHDNIDNVKKALEIFREHNVDFIVHCGDVVAPATVLYFKGFKTKWVFGNCDGDHRLLQERVAEIGGEHYGVHMDIEYKGKRIIAVHGDHPHVMQELIASGPDYLFHGHTHTPEDRQAGHTRVMCPGGHYMGDEKLKNKVIILNAEKNEATFIDVR